MSGIPPKIPASATSEGLRTPSHEWASQTASALGSETVNSDGSLKPTKGELQSMDPKYQHPESTNVAPKTTDEVVSKNPKYRRPEELTSSSTISTPGMPGAYHEDRGDSQDQSFSLSDTATKVSQTVQSTAHKAGETAVQYLPKSVVNTVSAYMPASLSTTSSTIRASSHDIAHVRSLPSSELTGTQPGEHVSGVGSLPGNISEVSVGKLPDERYEATSKESPADETWGVGGMVAGTAAGVGATVGTVYESVKSAVSGHPSDTDKSQTESGSDELKLPHDTQYTERRAQQLHEAAVTHEHEHEPAHPVRPFESLPSEEFPSTSRGGVGSLPGSTDEPGVAKLPDERKDSGERWGVSGAMAGAAAGVGATVGGVYEAVKSKVSGQHKVDTTHKSTLPSTEEPSTSPVGVGSLPGDIHEQGVAQLPDEPERKRSLGITGATDPGVGTHPHAYNFTESDLPSHEGGLIREPVGGVGSLPGDVGEEGVGLLPDERAASGQSKSLQEDLQEQKQRGEEFDERRGQAIAIGVGGVSAAKPVEKDKKGRPGAGETRRSEGEITKSREAALGAPVRKERRASEGAAKGMEGGVGDEAKKSERTKEDQAMAAGVGAAAVVGGRALGGKDNEGKKELGNEGGAKPQGEKKSGGPGESNQCGVSRNAEAVYPRRLVEYSDGGHRRREDEGSRDGDELVANLRRVTLTPRTHPLGGEGAHWGSTNISGDSYKRGDGVDIPEDECPGYDTDYHPAKLHPPPVKPSDTKKDTSKSEGDLGASERTTSKQGEKPAHEGVSEKAHEMKNDDDKAEKGHEKSKKVGFMEKMKGEAKMLFGKVEGGKKGEEKVEEGKRIKSGEAHAASSTKA